VSEFLESARVTFRRRRLCTASMHGALDGDVTSFVTLLKSVVICFFLLHFVLPRYRVMLRQFRAVRESVH
jgi:hypothetical protein